MTAREGGAWTAGPWEVTYREGRAAAMYGHNVSCALHAKPGVTAGCDGIAEVRGHSDEEARANARLIASAPALAECLREMVIVTTSYTATQKRREKAIESARALLSRLAGPESPKDGAR